MAKDKLTPRQKRFCDEYLIDQNGAAAAKRAGYKGNNTHVTASTLLTNPNVKKYLQENIEAMHNDRIMTAEEILQFFSDVATGKMEDVAVTPAGMIVEYKTTMKDRLRAAENLAKCHGMYDNRVKVEGQIPVVIVDDLEED